MMKLSLIIGLCICFFSCTSKQVEERTVQSFGETGKLTPEICHLPSPIYIPRYMGVTGDYLYVYKERENKKFVVFKLPEMKYLGEMGSIGQGPNDFNLLDTRSFKNTADGFQGFHAPWHGRTHGAWRRNTRLCCGTWSDEGA